MIYFTLITCKNDANRTATQPKINKTTSINLKKPFNSSDFII